MAIVSGYSSSEDEAETPKPQPLRLVKVDAAPDVPDAVEKEEQGDGAVYHNEHNGLTVLNNHAGVIIQEAVDDYTFESQRRAHEKRRNNADTSDRATKREAKRIKKRRVGKDDVDADYLGPWAKYKSSDEEEDVEEEELEEDEDEQEPQPQPQTESEDEAEEEEETTEFLGTAEHDYQGRTYMHIPTDVGVNLKSDEGPTECFVPKKQIHKWKGHAHGTTKLEFFPRSNHLLLSCGNDCKIFLWSVYHKRECLRGFYGHSKPVRDVSFNSDGTRFLSASYDKTVKLWDTETGQCLSRFTLSSVPNVVKFNSFNDEEFLVGLMNHKIEHYSLKDQTLLQRYDHHMGSIISLTFFPDKRFVSTSEDKTARVWDLQVNIPVKIISDPTLHSMPVTRVHPGGKYFAAQSMDNTVMVFGASGRYKTNKNKLFEGHNCAGFGIGIDISPDGKILVSGDSSGKAVFWDWKTCKVVTKLKVDERAITQVCWNSKEVSKVAMAGASGAIYYYE